MILHSYYSNSGKDLILDYVNSLPEDEKTDGLSVLECMENGEFDKINVKNEIEKQRQNDPKFKKAWDESRAGYKLIGEMISLRKQENITQKELAALTGNKQQVISRIERKESIPTIRAFSNILDALGYELQIVKKESI